MQKITLAGKCRLGRDAVIRETHGGSKVISFTVATNEYFKGVERTYWYEVSVFNYERYKNMVKHLTKGTSVFVVGESFTDIEFGKDGVPRCARYVIADYINFGENGESSGSTDSSTTVATSKPSTKAPDTDEDMPRATKKVAEAPVETGNTDDELPF